MVHGWAGPELFKSYSECVDRAHERLSEAMAAHLQQAAALNADRLLSGVDKTSDGKGGAPNQEAAAPSSRCERQVCIVRTSARHAR